MRRIALCIGWLVLLAAASVLSCVVAAVSAFDRSAAAELRNAGRSTQRAQTHTQLAGGGSHRELCRCRLRGGGAHAPGHEPAAQAVPAERADQPRATARFALEALHGALATAAA